MKYQERICCFIDILGFKKHIDETINDSGEENLKKNRINKTYSKTV